MPEQVNMETVAMPPHHGKPADAAGRQDIRLVPLDAVPDGARARVRLLRSADDDGLLKLAGLGLLPGTHLEVIRHAPALCVRLHDAFYAIDAALARRILVEIEGPHAGAPRPAPPHRYRHGHAGLQGPP